MDKKPCNSQDVEVRKGPWTMEEDLVLISYIANHGEGVWNSLAKAAGLKRTGKSCRLRWINYLRPDVRRGNITPEEQLLIMELHAKWGNRWSKIAKHLPGRTDNEIKNYWRTRIQKRNRQADGGGQSSCEINESGSRSSSQISTILETYSPPSNNYQTTNNSITISSSNNNNNNNNLDAFQGAYLPHPIDNYWSMEDLWSIQLLNGD